MDKRIAFVTGGMGGIGTAICQRLAKDHQVIAGYFQGGAASKWQQQQKDAGFDIDIMYGDISNFSECDRMVRDVTEKYGRLDVLVNNAGITRDSSLKKMTLDQWQEVIDVNLSSVFNMTRHVLPHMLEQNFGRIISISSINGRKGQFGQCNYAATKAGLYGFSKSLAQEVAKKGITVNTISPGYIETPMLSTLSDDILNAIIAEIPMGRLGKPEEIAAVVACLASDDMAFMTGANIDINGGQYM